MQTLLASDNAEMSKAIYVEARVANEKKSTAVAYLLWFFLGGFGAHNFYLGRKTLGTAELICVWVGVVGFLISQSPIFVLMWGAGAVMLLCDIFIIPGGIQADAARLRSKLQGQFPG